jgi:hypothetical protein
MVKSTQEPLLYFVLEPIFRRISIQLHWGCFDPCLPAVPMTVIELLINWYHGPLPHRTRISPRLPCVFEEEGLLPDTNLKTARGRNMKQSMALESDSGLPDEVRKTRGKEKSPPSFAKMSFHPCSFSFLDFPSDYYPQVMPFDINGAIDVNFVNSTRPEPKTSSQTTEISKPENKAKTRPATLGSASPRCPSFARACYAAQPT